MDTVDWLLDSDPAISWQAMRDLTDASPAAIAAARARIPREGLGAEILARQEPDGSWRRPNEPAWLPTLFTLLLLRATGVDPAEPAVESAIARLEASLRWNDGETWDLRAAELGGNRFFEGEAEPCINGGVLALGAYFRRPAESLARRLLGEQLEDGGWNCEAPRSTRSSFHTTICVLEGLLEYEREFGSTPQIASARRLAEEYLLERGLFRRRSTGEVANPAFLELAFPPRYHYDVLRALDYFRNADGDSGRGPDARIRDAVQLIESRRQAGVPGAPGIGAMGWKTGVPGAPGIGAMGWKTGVPGAPGIGAMGWKTGVPGAPGIGAMGWKTGVPGAPGIGAMGWKTGVPGAPGVGAMGWKTDGRWLLDRAYDEALAVPVGESAGEPSRWNTLRALRVLRWYERRGIRHQASSKCAASAET